MSAPSSALGVEPGLDLDQQGRGPVAVVDEPGPADGVVDQRADAVALAQLPVDVAQCRGGRLEGGHRRVGEQLGTHAGQLRLGGGQRLAQRAEIRRDPVAWPSEHAHDAAHPSEF